MYFNNTNVPIKFQSQCSQLKQRCRDGLDDLAFREIIDSALSLLLEIKNYSISEQQSLEAFLAEIPQRLNVLQQYKCPDKVSKPVFTTEATM